MTIIPEILDQLKETGAGDIGVAARVMDLHEAAVELLGTFNVGED